MTRVLVFDPAVVPIDERASPTTSNATSGAATPIPTFPVEVIRTRSKALPPDGLVLNTKAPSYDPSVEFSLTPEISAHAVSRFRLLLLYAPPNIIPPPLPTANPLVPYNPRVPLKFPAVTEEPTIDAVVSVEISAAARNCCGAIINLLFELNVVEALIAPATSNATSGAATPIPTLPYAIRLLVVFVDDPTRT